MTFWDRYDHATNVVRRETGYPEESRIARYPLFDGNRVGLPAVMLDPASLHKPAFPALRILLAPYLPISQQQADDHIRTPKLFGMPKGFRAHCVTSLNNDNFLWNTPKNSLSLCMS